jgi:hypothetical protein
LCHSNATTSSLLSGICFLHVNICCGAVCMSLACARSPWRPSRSCITYTLLLLLLLAVSVTAAVCGPWAALLLLLLIIDPASTATPASVLLIVIGTINGALLLLCVSASCWAVSSSTTHSRALGALPALLYCKPTGAVPLTLSLRLPLINLLLLLLLILLLLLLLLQALLLQVCAAACHSKVAAASPLMCHWRRAIASSRSHHGGCRPSEG